MWCGAIKSFQADISYRLVRLPLEFTYCTSASLTAVASLELLFHDAAQHCLWFSLNTCLETGRPYIRRLWTFDLILHVVAYRKPVLFWSSFSSQGEILQHLALYTHPIHVSACTIRQAYNVTNTQYRTFCPPEQLDALIPHFYQSNLMVDDLNIQNPQLTFGHFWNVTFKHFCCTNGIIKKKRFFEGFHLRSWCLNNKTKRYTNSVFPTVHHFAGLQLQNTLNTNTLKHQMHKTVTFCYNDTHHINWQ